MALTGQHNFELNQGVDYTQSMVWAIDAVPVAMSGYTAKMQLKGAANEPGIVTEFNTSDTSIILHPSNGTITFHKTAVQTGAIPAGIYVYDLVITDASGVPTRLLEGKFTVNAGVTA